MKFYESLYITSRNPRLCFVIKFNADNFLKERENLQQKELSEIKSEVGLSQI